MAAAASNVFGSGGLWRECLDGTEPNFVAIFAFYVAMVLKSCGVFFSSWLSRKFLWRAFRFSPRIFCTSWLSCENPWRFLSITRQLFDSSARFSIESGDIWILRFHFCPCYNLANGAIFCYNLAEAQSFAPLPDCNTSHSDDLMKPKLCFSSGKLGPQGHDYAQNWLLRPFPWLAAATGICFSPQDFKTAPLSSSYYMCSTGLVFLNIQKVPSDFNLIILNIQKLAAASI